MVINFFWVGDSLSSMERLTLRSHLKQGHECHLWTYGPVAGIPSGVSQKNAREILDDEFVFAYNVGEGRGSFSACSNLFRYKLLLDVGGWWSDSDVVALKPFDFEQPYVFASERKKIGSCQRATCVMKAPAGSEMIRYCWDCAQTVDRSTVSWGTIGPTLLSRSVVKYNLEKYAVPPQTFCPLNWFDAETNATVSGHTDLTESHAVHLWNEMWRRKGIDKDGSYDSFCLYERLKDAFLRTPNDPRCEVLP